MGRASTATRSAKPRGTTTARATPKKKPAAKLGGPHHHASGPTPSAKKTTTTKRPSKKNPPPQVRLTKTELAAIEGLRRRGAHGCAKCRFGPKGCGLCRSLPPTDLSTIPPLARGQTAISLKLGKNASAAPPNAAFVGAFAIVDGPEQSDAHGFGVVATRRILAGERFVDQTVPYVDRAAAYARAHFDPNDYIAVGDCAYFLLREPVLRHLSFTYHANEARGMQEANVAWIISRRVTPPALEWVALADIEPRQEILVDYAARDDLSNNKTARDLPPEPLLSSFFPGENSAGSSSHGMMSPTGRPVRRCSSVNNVDSSSRASSSADSKSSAFSPKSIS